MLLKNYGKKTFTITRGFIDIERLRNKVKHHKKITKLK